jgi:plasmid stability protein
MGAFDFHNHPLTGMVCGLQSFFLQLIVPRSRFGVDLKPKWYHNETVLFRKEGIMASITIKNIPEELYEKLKKMAAVHRRSINSETINCLETVLMPRRITVSDRIQRARKLRSQLMFDRIDPNEISDAISEGRP